MITTLSVERFKSIKSLTIPCRKVNVFIGAPDTGKTNLLEALYLLSRLGWNWPLDSSLRIRQGMGFDALFYRQYVFAFPKTLGEMIGADRSNQFFLTTHNPYFLAALLGRRRSRISRSSSAIGTLRGPPPPSCCRQMR